MWCRLQVLASVASTVVRGEEVAEPLACVRKDPGSRRHKVTIFSHRQLAYHNYNLS